MPIRDEEETEAMEMGREAGIDRADINTCPYGALDPCRRLWLRAYLNALSRPRTEETETP